MKNSKVNFKIKHLAISNFMKTFFKINLIKEIFSRKNDNDCKSSVSSSFKQSLDILMKTLNKTTTHYIRCIIPNKEKKPFVFDNKIVEDQLKALGIIEAMRLSAKTFPIKYEYGHFIQLYKSLAELKLNQNDERENCQRILKKYIDGKYQCGKTKIFIQVAEKNYLDRLNLEMEKNNNVKFTPIKIHENGANLSIKTKKKTSNQKKVPSRLSLLMTENCSPQVIVKTPSNDYIRRAFEECLRKENGVEVEKSIKEDDNENQILKDTCINVFWRIERNKKIELYKIIELLGGSINFFNLNGCSHFIYDKSVKDLDDRDLKLALNQKQIVLSSTWLYECKNRKERVPEDKYKLNS
jgi:myosin heavy subunit